MNAARSSADPLRVLTLCGSLRQASLTKALLLLAEREAPQGLAFANEPLHDIPPFDADIQAMGFPPPVARIRDAIRSADAVLIGTPEYNFSIPGVLKNALDWVSRGDRPPFVGKAVGILSCSTGPWGGARVQYDLRKVMLSMEAHVIGKPEVFVGSASGKFDSTGGCTDEPTRDAVIRYMAAFKRWVTATRHFNMENQEKK
ncbi:MAG: NADPH-dependent oxidoreductase [Ramlibacter sp.]|nr:NADPH-dependent oxidoreductase [Ramlibacter sp.]